jgi:hypothetical protein
MQYFQAVKIGKQRANKSQMNLFNLAGFAMLTLTTKKKDGTFIPVGEEELTAIIQSPDGYIVVIVDEDGYTKTQSRAIEKDEVLKIYKKIIDSGIKEYSGNEIEIWNQTYKTIQNELK